MTHLRAFGGPTIDRYGLKSRDRWLRFGANQELNYLKTVTGGHLRAEGRCLRAGRQISYTECSVFDEAGELVAHGTSTLMALPGKGLTLGVSKFLPD